jgi:hypothetical protein
VSLHLLVVSSPGVRKQRLCQNNRRGCFHHFQLLLLVSQGGVPCLIFGILFAGQASKFVLEGIAHFVQIEGLGDNSSVL